MFMQSLQCEMARQATVHNNKNKIKIAYEKLEDFYRLLGDIYHHQVSGTPLVLDQWIQLLYSTSYQYNDKYGWIHKTHHRSKQGTTEETSFSEDFQGILEALLSELSILEDEEEMFQEAGLFKEMDFESALEDAFTRQVRLDEEVSVSSPRVKITSTRKPNPSLVVKISDPSSPAVVPSVTTPTATPPPLYDLAADKSLCPNLLLPYTCSGTTPTQSAIKSEIPKETNAATFTPEKKTKYTEAYKQMEFIPYNALPPQIEEVVFPSSSTAVFNDPYWPNKKQCLELVEDASDHLPRFTGTFLSPEARGVK